jgi:hypothetical protein
MALGQRGGKEPCLEFMMHSREVRGEELCHCELEDSWTTEERHAMEVTR